MTPSPPLTALPALPAQMHQCGWAVLDAATLGALCGWVGGPPAHWAGHWADLPPDPHLRDGGRYRRRRHGCFLVDAQGARAVPHRAHWQPLEYNALHGGYERWFEPLPEALVADARWACLMGCVSCLD